MKHRGWVINFGTLLKQTYKVWWAGEPFNNSIIISYYAIFSLPGLLVIIVNLAGFFFGEEAVTNRISSEIGGLVGGDTAKDIEQLIIKASQNQGTVLATILSITILLIGATGIFYRLQSILDKMWKVEPKPRKKFLKLIRARIFSFGLILVVGFLLLVSLVLTALIAAMSDWFASNISERFVVIFSLADIIISIGVITLLFAAIYKFLPDAKIRWKDVWVGAMLTSILFVFAKFLLGLYFGHSDPASTYGAAGSIILIMLWVSYAGLILLFGAEFTKIYADTYGVKVKPAEYAVSTEKKKKNNNNKKLRMKKVENSKNRRRV